MARIPMLRTSRNAAFLALGGGAVVLTQLPRRHAWAEAPVDELPSKKPIYSSPPTVPANTKPSPTSPVSTPNPTNPTPTDRIQKYVRATRLFLHSQAQSAETAVNNLATWAFDKETRLADTVASLAPAPSTGEQLLPGAIYVLVATMAGSIISRNRNILIRATFPLAVGITAGWYLIPVTMQNTADLLWVYEKKVPIISETHSMIGGFTREAWKQTKAHADLVGRWAEREASEQRERVEKWVEKGK